MSPFEWRMEPPSDDELIQQGYEPQQVRGLINAMRVAVMNYGGFLDKKAVQAKGIHAGDPRILWFPGEGAPAFQFKDDGTPRLDAAMIHAENATQNPYARCQWWFTECKGELPVDLLLRGEVIKLHGIPSQKLTLRY